jgi:hypothetical protein
MRILIACEESQAVTKEFRRLGHDAFSCDIEPCSGGHPKWHIKCDVALVLEQDWDMIIAFPPCTHLASSGARWFKDKIADGRQQQGVDFFMLFANHLCQRVSIENPVGVMSSKWRKPDQIIQPYHFGHPESKSTCLWLRGLPKLKPTKVIEKPKTGWENCTPSGQNKLGPSADRAKLRSKTYSGIAKAMAEQWGNIDTIPEDEPSIDWS